MKNHSEKLKMKNNEEYKRALIHRSYNFSLAIMRMLDMMQKDFSSEIVAKQILRSATSVGANIIEAQAASSKRDFINFLHHALKSANETKYWLGLLRDGQKIDREYASKLLEEAIELSRMLGSSLLVLKGKKNNF